MTQARYSGRIEALRFASTTDVLREIAWELGLCLQYNVIKHIIRETVFFEVRGKTEQVLRFRDILDRSVAEYNAEITA